MTKLLEAHGLQFRYPNRKEQILSGINFKVQPGELIFLTGPSGGGKSTLAYCLAGFIPHYLHGTFSGTVIINGRPNSETPLNEISGCVGLVQQNPEDQLIMLNVKNELAFGLENFCLPTKKILERIAWISNILGLNQLLDRETHSLSGGEKQKVAIGAILALRPQYLILDEPSASLDPPSAVKLYNFLKQLCLQENIGIMVIEHRVRYINFAERILWLEKGKKIVELSKENIMRKFMKLSKVNEAISLKEDKKELLTIKKLNFSFSKRPILTDVNFSVNEGEILGVMGANGSGKTTLLRLIEGLLVAADSKFIFKNEEISHTGASQRAKEIGLIFQNPNHQIFEKTVWKEVMIGPRNFKLPIDEVSNSASELLDNLGLLEYKNTSPFGLSHGEKRRLNVTSIEVYNPSLLLLDEPFTGQDINNIQNIMNILERRKKLGLATILVSHDSDIIHAFCDRAVFLEKGKILVDATIDNFFRELVKLGKRDFVSLPIREVS